MVKQNPRQYWTGGTDPPLHDNVWAPTPLRALLLESFAKVSMFSNNQAYNSTKSRRIATFMFAVFCSAASKVLPSLQIMPKLKDAKQVEPS